jgi:hypothetical protein
VDRKRPEEWEDHGEPVVIPLPPEEALRALLAVNPDDEPSTPDDSQDSER